MYIFVSWVTNCHAVLQFMCCPTNNSIIQYSFWHWKATPDFKINSMRFRVCATIFSGFNNSQDTSEENKLTKSMHFSWRDIRSLSSLFSNISRKLSASVYSTTNRNICPPDLAPYTCVHPTRHSTHHQTVLRSCQCTRA